MVYTLVFILCIWIAMIATGIWESCVEGRNAWDKGKFGWKIKVFGFVISQYHFFLFVVMWPALLILPFLVVGWDFRLFGIILSSFFSGLIIEDITWYMMNPKVKFREFYTKFSDYYPWIRFGKVKIIPLSYIVGILISFTSWYFIWR